MFPEIIRGQTPVSLLVTELGAEQGLSQSMVSQVCQDSRGLMWMVTGDGLQCYNGEDFRVFRLPEDQSDSYSENIMREITEYRPGRFTISTTSSILDFNSNTGQFKVAFHKPGHYPRLFNVLLNNTPLSWTSQYKFGFVDRNAIQPVELSMLNPQRIPPAFNPVKAVRSRTGTILVQSAEGVLEILGRSNKNPNSLNARWMPLEKGCQGLSVNKAGDVFFLSGEAILQYFGNGVVKKFKNLQGISGTYLFIDRSDHEWIYDKYLKKLFRISGMNPEEVKLLGIDGKHTDPVQPRLISMYEDRQGNIWFGTDGNGLLVYSPGLKQFDKYETGFTRCLLRIGNSVYAGTYNNGLWKITPGTGAPVRLNPKGLDNQIYFLDLTADRLGRIWAHTDKGMFIIDPEGLIRKVFPGSFRNGTFIPSTGDTIRLVAENALFTYLTGKLPVKVSETYYPNVRFIQKINDYNWVGTSLGIFRFRDEGAMDRIRDFQPRNQISARAVYGLTLLNDTVWAATERGIECYSANGKKISSPSVLENIKHDVINAIESDPSGKIWFSGNKGIMCLLQGRDRIITFNSANNLQSLEFNTNASLPASDGLIWFGGIVGVNSLNTRLFCPVKPGPEARLFSLSVSDTSYSAGIPPEFLKLELDRRQPHFSGSVFTSDYPNSGMGQYSFLLKGYQDSWSQWGKNPSFTYRNLPPGQYKLWVRCTDSYMNQGSARELLTVLIRPPFWKTGWFVTAMLLMMILFTVFIVRKIQGIRYSARLRELERQNAVEKERLRISKDMHDEIGASLTRISILSELAKKQGTDKGPVAPWIDQINQIAGNVVDEMSEIIWAINPKNDILESFASYVRQYASGYLETAGIEGNFNFSDEIPRIPMSAEHRRNIFLVVKEALHNTVKYSGATELEMNLSLEGLVLQLLIRDNGSGFELEDRLGKGNGLVNMRKRIEDLDGRFSISSAPGNGTQISISVKLSGMSNNTKR